MRAKTPGDVGSAGMDEAEVVQIAFDPDDISYADLLGIFFALHDPTTRGAMANGVDSRDGSAVFFSSQEQERVAREAVVKLQPAFRDPIVTQIVESGPFRASRDFDQVRCERHDGAARGAPRHRLADAISDLFARQAAEMIERRRAEEEARRTSVRLERNERMAHAGSGSMDVRTGGLVRSGEHHRIRGLDRGAPITHEQAVAMARRDERVATCETGRRAIAAARSYELMTVGQACADIEVLIATGAGVRESIHIPLRDGVLAGGSTVGSIADEIARRIFAKLPRRREAPAPAPSLSPQRLRRVLAHIEEHLGEHVAVRQLAAVACMSVFHFARMFKGSVGMPPHAYMTQRRIERAKEMLARTELALVEVAARAGFQTQAHFTVVFHRHVGLPPRAFRLRAHASADAR
jgi:AraC-like DNA-binding protein